MVIKGLDPEARVVKEKTGGVHSELDYRLDLLLPKAIFRLGKILKLGADKGYPHPADNPLPAMTHVNHALGHVMGWLMKDEQGDHLAHAFCRLMMAMEVENGERIQESINPGDNIGAEFTSPLKSQEEDGMRGGGMEYIYICSPLSGDIKANVERVMKALETLKGEWAQRGKMPLVLCPHTMFYGISFDFDGEDREWGMQMALETVKLCDMMIVLGDRITSGMNQEIGEALRLNKKIERRRDL